MFGRPNRPIDRNFFNIDIPPEFLHENKREFSFTQTWRWSIWKREKPLKELCSQWQFNIHENILEQMLSSPSKSLKCRENSPQETLLGVTTALRKCPENTLRRWINAALVNQKLPLIYQLQNQVVRQANGVRRSIHEDPVHSIKLVILWSKTWGADDGRRSHSVTPIARARPRSRDVLSRLVRTPFSRRRTETGQ